MWIFMSVQGKTWKNTGGVDISLDNLSPASRFKKQPGPSMNQLQQQGNPGE